MSIHTPEKRSAQAGRYDFEGGRLRWMFDDDKDQQSPSPGKFVEVPVGPLVYRLHLHRGELRHPRGHCCNGLCFPDSEQIFVAANQSRQRRLATAWHEFGHAMLDVFNIGEREELDEESICDAVGLFFASLTPEKYREIVDFLVND